MSFYLVRLKNGHYAPYDTTDHEASAKVPVGGVVKATKSRNYQFHKKLMALFQIGFDNQDIFKTFDGYRYAKTMDAGFKIGDGGRERAESLSFDTMGAEKFERVFNGVMDLIASDMDTAPETIKKEVEGFY